MVSMWTRLRFWLEDTRRAHFPSRYEREAAADRAEERAANERMRAELREVGWDPDRLSGDHDRLEPHRRAAIAQARASATDKEPFDLDRLLGLYWPESVMGGNARVTALFVDELLEKYYVWSPEMRTLAEFAEHLRLMDVYDSGGSD